MDPDLKKAYADLEDDIRDALREHHGNASVISTAMNALLLYPDRPFGLGTLYGFSTNPESGERERFVIADPPDLDEQFTYAKERRLIEEIRQELGTRHVRCRSSRCTPRNETLRDACNPSSARKVFERRC